MMFRCPHCGEEIDIPSRAPLGTGTRRGREIAINANRRAILDAMSSIGKPATVKDVQRKLMDLGVMRVSNRGVGWNYHAVQADMSLLLGGGHIRMLMRQLEVTQTFNANDGWSTMSVPTYEVA